MFTMPAGSLPHPHPLPCYPPLHAQHPPPGDLAGALHAGLQAVADSSNRVAMASLAASQRQAQADRPGDAETTEGKGKLDLEVAAAVQGWSGVPRRDLLADAFHEKKGFPAKRTLEGKRKFFKAGIVAWAKRHNKRIDEDTVRHDDTQIGDIARGNFMPFGQNPAMCHWTRGLGFASVGPKNAKAQAVEAQTEELAKKLGVVVWKKGDPPPPARTYDELLTRIWTHCGELAVTLTETCPLYLGLCGLGELIEAPGMRRKREYFTPFFIAKLTFAIQSEEWDYFATEVTPEEWETGTAVPPRNLLPTLYDKVRTFNIEARPGFPDAWRPGRGSSKVAPEDEAYHVVGQHGVVSKFSATGGFAQAGATLGVPMAPSSRSGVLPAPPGARGSQPASPGASNTERGQHRGHTPWTIGETRWGTCTQCSAASCGPPSKNTTAG